MSDIISDIAQLSPQSFAVAFAVYAGVKAVEFVVDDHWAKTAFEEKSLYDSLTGDEFERSRQVLRQDIQRRINTACSQRSVVHFIWHNCGATRFALLLALLLFVRLLFRSNDWTEVSSRLFSSFPALTQLFMLLLVFDLAVFLYDKLFRGRVIDCLKGVFKNLREKHNA